MRSFRLLLLVCALALVSSLSAQTPGSIVSISGVLTYTMHPQNTVIVVNPSAGNMTVTLTAPTNAGQEVSVILIGTPTNTVTVGPGASIVDRNGLRFMGGGATCQSGDALHLVADGNASWYVLDGNNNNCANHIANLPPGAQVSVAQGTAQWQTLYWDNTSATPGWNASNNLTNNSPAGRVGVGTATPSDLFAVGATSPLSISNAGKLTTSGGMTLTGLGSAAASFWLVLDGSNNVVKSSAPAVTGSGTTNTLPIWTGTYTLGDSRFSQTATEIVAADDIFPSANATYDLGATATRWRNGWFSGTLTAAGAVASGGLTMNGSVAPRTLTSDAALTISTTGANNLVLTPGTGSVTISTMTTNGVVHTTGGTGTLSAGPVNLAGGATEISNQLPLANGGTNANLTASNGGIFYSTATAGAILAGTATANQLLLSGASGAPSWSTATYPPTTTANQLLYSSATNTVGGLTTANNGVLITGGTGIPSISSTLPNAVQLNITSLGTVGTGVWQGTAVGAQYGGTGLNTSATAIGAMLYTSAIGTWNTLAASTNGNVITQAGGVPTWGTVALGSANSVSGTLLVGNGGTGATTLTNHGILLGQGTNAVVPTAVMTDGQLLVGQSAADPLPKTISGDATMAATGALTIANQAVTYAKIQNVGAGKLLGNSTGLAASTQEITPTSGITLSGGNLGLGAITPTTVNGLTLTALATGFTVAGGTTSKTLTVPLDASVSNTNTGDVTLAGENYLSLSGQQITANAVNLGGTNATGTLAAGRFPALTGDVTTTAGALGTTIANQAVTYAKIQNVGAGKLLGNSTGGAASTQEITPTSGITLSGGNLGLGAITPTTVNGLTLTALATGFTVAGGTTSKTLTVPLDASVSNTNTGDVTLAGENYLSLSGQQITANAVNLGGTNATGTLAAGRFPALTGDVTTTAGALGTTIANQAVTYAKIQNVAAGKLLGNSTGLAASTQEITPTSGITLSGGNLGLGAITPTTVNGLTLTALATGFTVAGGTTSKTLTVPLDASVSNTNTGDVTLAGENYLSLSGQQITANAVNLGGTNATGTLAAGRFPALTGDVTTTAGALGTTIANQAVTYAKIQNVGAGKLLGNSTGLAASTQEITPTSGITLSGGNLGLGAITPTTVNGLTLTALATGFTVAGGTTSKTLTVPLDASVSNTNTGDVTLAGENYLSLSGQQITANAVNLGGTNATGTLAAGRFPALTGDVTTTAGALGTTIANQAVTYAKIQNVANGKILGRATAGAGVVEEIGLGTGLALSGTTLNATGVASYNAVVPAGNAITVDGTFGVWELQADATPLVGVAVTLGGTGASNGQFLVIYNGDVIATTGQVINPGAAALYIRVAGTWIRLV